MVRRLERHQQRAQALRDFTTTHGRLPHQSRPEERSLYFWLKRVENRRVTGITAELAAEMAELARTFRRKPPTNPANIARANENRAAAAAARTAPAAAAVLENCSAEHLPVLQLRIEHPTASLGELAGRMGVTKHAYAGRLRRALAHRGR